MLKAEERLEYNQLLDEFLLGCKTAQRIGMEYERIPVSNIQIKLFLMKANSVLVNY